LPGLATKRFKLNPKTIWPENSDSQWPHVENINRDVLTTFCDRFVVEISCPRTSGDLRNPGPLERALLSLLHDQIGIGIWPNHNCDLSDAAAHLIKAASAARAKSAACDQQSVIETLALRIDYGGVEEDFTVDESRLVTQSNILGEISTILISNPRVAVIGSPGIGKSWLLHQLGSHLSAAGWIVASHYSLVSGKTRRTATCVDSVTKMASSAIYGGSTGGSKLLYNGFLAIGGGSRNFTGKYSYCFIDLFDTDRVRRASVETVFGSILAQLLDKDPSLATDTVPRFAAGPHELEKLLKAGMSEIPNRHIAIIIDGLDHADRLTENSRSGLAADIVQELATIQIPSGLTIIIGSQPGDHLSSFLACGTEYFVRRWNDESIQMLVNNMGICEILSEYGLRDEYSHIQEVITNKAAGNPLYATYLTRTAITIARRNNVGPIGDICEYLSL